MTDATWAIPLADVEVDEQLRRAALETVESGWWSMGPRVVELERAFAEFCGVEHAIAVANGTAALHLALLATGCGPGDEVVVPSLNFVAAANCVGFSGATPVFCDVNGPEDLNLDPADVEAAVSDRTKALLVLHYGGYPCDMEAVLAIAGARDLLVIEDAAHAPGATWNGRACGTIGAVGCFSFFSNKNLPVGEGGMIVTSDDEIAARIRLLRSHGMTTLTWDRHRGHAGSYDVVTRGLNYRLDEIRAAIALVQLERLRDGNEARRRHAARYREGLDGREGIVLPFPSDAAQAASSHHLAVAVLPDGVDRQAVRESLAGRRIQTSVHYPPIHRFSAYSSLEPQRELPATDAVAERLLTLPLFPHMSDEQVDTVVDALLETVQAPQVLAAGGGS